MSRTPRYTYTSPTERSSLLVANGRINSISSSVFSTDTSRSSPSLSALTSLSRGDHSRTHRRIRSWLWAWEWAFLRTRHSSSWVEDGSKPLRSTCPSDENLELISNVVGPLQVTDSKRQKLLLGIWLAQFLAVGLISPCPAAYNLKRNLIDLGSQPYVSIGVYLALVRP